MQEMQEMQVRFLSWEDPLEEDMAIHPSVFAWRIPWTEEPGGLQSFRSQRVGHNQAIKHSSKPPVMSERPVGRKKKVMRMLRETFSSWILSTSLHSNLEKIQRVNDLCLWTESRSGKGACILT